MTPKQTAIDSAVRTNDLHRTDISMQRRSNQLTARRVPHLSVQTPKASLPRNGRRLEPVELGHRDVEHHDIWVKHRSLSRKSYVMLKSHLFET